MLCNILCGPKSYFYYVILQKLISESDDRCSNCLTNNHEVRVKCNICSDMLLCLEVKYHSTTAAYYQNLTQNIQLT